METVACFSKFGYKLQFVQCELVAVAMVYSLQLPLYQQSEEGRSTTTLVPS